MDKLVHYRTIIEAILEEAGVPKEDIVLAFYPPKKRP